MKSKVFEKNDLKLICYLIVYYTIVVALSTAKVVSRRLMLIEEGRIKTENANWASLFYNLFLDWIIVIGIMVLVVYLTKMMIRKKIKWKYILFVHLFFALTLGWVIYFIYNLISTITGRYQLSELFNEISFQNIIGVADLNFLIYTAMTAIIYIYYYVQEIKQIENQKAELAVQLTNTKLSLLKSNLHPHFIFNTLNSISALVETDKQQAQNTLADLGDILRDLLDQKDKTLITLNEELKILKKYLNIIKVRFSDHFVFKEDITANLKAKVPNMLLQPLIENAVKHGYSLNYTSLDILLEIKEANNYLNIFIYNNGTPLKADFSFQQSGYGIKNTLERLKTIYKNDFEFELKNDTNTKQVIVYIRLPLIVD